MRQAGYLFVTFTDGREDGEQIYFAISRDGLHWQDLNGGNPVLTSSIGEKGARDPFLLRSVDGSHFYLIATDLRIANGKGWDAAQYAGSRDLLIWESDDLIHWSEERSVTASIPEISKSLPSRRFISSGRIMSLIPRSWRITASITVFPKMRRQN